MRNEEQDTRTRQGTHLAASSNVIIRCGSTLWRKMYFRVRRAAIRSGSRARKSVFLVRLTTNPTFSQCCTERFCCPTPHMLPLVKNRTVLFSMCVLASRFSLFGVVTNRTPLGCKKPSDLLNGQSEVLVAQVLDHFYQKNGVKALSAKTSRKTVDKTGSNESRIVSALRNNCFD